METRLFQLLTLNLGSLICDVFQFSATKEGFLKNIKKFYMYVFEVELP